MAFTSRLIHSLGRLCSLSLTTGLALSILTGRPVLAAVTFTGVASGDASSTGATFWTRALDTTVPANTAITLQITTDPTFASGISTVNGTTDSTKDYTYKVDVTGLTPNTVYYYRFVGPASELSIVGKIKTAPDASASAPLHFAFSGDNDGLMRPYALASQIPAQNLDFYMNLGDVIYENASNVAGNNSASWLNSPSVTLSSDSLSFNGIPRAFIPAGTPFATQAQLRADYAKKYRENFLPVNTGGQNSLQDLYAAQGNYTTWDNHELGNRKYIDGGAPAGGSVGGAAGTDMATGRGVDARAYTGSNTGGSGNVNNVNDVNTSTTDFMNRATGFLALEDVFLSYQPIADRGLISAPTDPRTDGTKQLYSAQQWGKNAIFINTDSRSYRDIRIKTATGSADDTTAPRANNPGRTYFGATQLAWLKQTLLNAQNAGTPWKFVSVSDPMDQIGPIGGALTLSNLPNFCNPVSPCSYSPVNSDGGKAAMGGYRAERNDLLKFIADNQITNVVFLGADDHQNRLNELAYSPTGQTEVQSSYVKAPYVFSIVAGPLGATGPDLITNHTFAMAQATANSLNAAQTAAGIEPFGLIGYPGLHDLARDGDPTAGTSPQPVDFYSPDTFNFTVLDVDTTGKTLTVSSVGMEATAQNAAKEYANGPQSKTIFSFKVDAAPPIIATQPASPTIANGQTATLSVVATGTGLTYQWYRVDPTVNTALRNATSSTYTTSALPASKSYFVRVTDSFGSSVDSSIATVTVLPVAPVITTQPASITIGYGKTATLRVTVTGTSPVYQWYQGATGDTSTPAPGISNSRSFITPALTSTITYWVRVSNSGGSADSTTTTVTVNPAVPVITKQPASKTIATGQTATLSVVATGTGLSYQWYEGTSGTTTTSVGTDSSSFTTPALTTTTSYWVKVSNVGGFRNSATATVTVTP